MARIPDLRLLKKEDFDAKDQTLVDKLAFPINNFMQQVVNVLKNGVDFTNLNQQVLTITVSVDSSGTPTSNIQFPSSLSTKVQGLICINAVNTTTSGNLPSAQPFLSYTQNNSMITVNKITGIPVTSGQTYSDRYTLTILAIGQNLPTS